MTNQNYFSYLIYDWTDTVANSWGENGTFKDKKDLRKQWSDLIKEYDLSPHRYSLYVELITVIENGVRSKKLENEINQLGKELIKQYENKTGKKVNDW